MIQDPSHFKNQGVILIADDDVDDCEMIQDAFKENQLHKKIHFVKDGEELMAYLQHQGEYQDKSKYPPPVLILLDLNMPKKDGREALIEIKNNENLRQFPIIVLTTSQAEEDVIRSYNLGVVSFISKPTSFKELVLLMRDLSHHWTEVVKQPKEVSESK